MNLYKLSYNDFGERYIIAKDFTQATKKAEELVYHLRGGETENTIKSLILISNNVIN